MIFYLLIFAFVVALVFGWLGSLIIFCGAKASHSPANARSAGKVLIGLSGLTVLTGLGLWFLFSPSAKVIYQREFGESPSADVTNLYGLNNSFYDSGIVKLRFQAAPATFRHLAKIQKLPLIPRAKLKKDFAESDAPDWWKPQVGAQSQLYSGERSKETGGFAKEWVWLLYDPQTQTAYYSFEGID